MYGIAEATRNARRHVLTRTEEIRLHEAFMAGDDAAGHRIVTSFLPMLMRTARGHDALGVAVATFMEHLPNYDPTRGTRIWTYLRLPVVQAMLTYHLDRRMFFRLKSPRQRRAALSLEIEKKKLGASGRPLTGREARIIARVFGTSEDVVHGLDDDMSIMRVDPLSHDRSDHHGVEDPERADGHLEFERRHDHERLMSRVDDALATLSGRERDLIARRFKEEPDPLKTIGCDMGISGERVRQIESRALQRMRRTIDISGRRPSQGAFPHGIGFATLSPSQPSASRH